MLAKLAKNTNHNIIITTNHINAALAKLDFVSFAPLLKAHINSITTFTTGIEINNNTIIQSPTESVS